MNAPNLVLRDRRRSIRLYTRYELSASREKLLRQATHMLLGGLNALKERTPGLRTPFDMPLGGHVQAR